MLEHLFQNTISKLLSNLSIIRQFYLFAWNTFPTNIFCSTRSATQPLFISLHKVRLKINIKVSEFNLLKTFSAGTYVYKCWQSHFAISIGSLSGTEYVCCFSDEYGIIAFETITIHEIIEYLSGNISKPPTKSVSILKLACVREWLKNWYGIGRLC